MTRRPTNRRPRRRRRGYKGIRRRGGCGAACAHPQCPKPRREEAQFIDSGCPWAGDVGGTVFRRAPRRRKQARRDSSPCQRGALLLLGGSGSTAPRKNTISFPTAAIAGRPAPRGLREPPEPRPTPAAASPPRPPCRRHGGAEVTRNAGTLPSCWDTLTGGCSHLQGCRGNVCGAPFGVLSAPFYICQVQGLT